MLLLLGETPSVEVVLSVAWIQYMTSSVILLTVVIGWWLYRRGPTHRRNPYRCVYPLHILFLLFWFLWYVSTTRDLAPALDPTDSFFSIYIDFLFILALVTEGVFYRFARRKPRIDKRNIVNLKPQSFSKS